MDRQPPVFPLNSIQSQSLGGVGAVGPQQGRCPGRERLHAGVLRFFAAISIPRPLLPLFLLLLLGNVLDAVFTYIGIIHWGLEVEMNGLARWLFVTIGPLAGVIVAKSWATIWAFVLAYVSKRKGSRYGKRVFLTLCAAVYLIAVTPWLYFLISRA